MSFGFGIGDIIAVSQLANKVRKRFVDSPDQFKAISDERTRKRLSEVKSLSNVLRDFEDVLPERELTLRQQQNSRECIQGCENVLKDLDEMIDKYQSLDSKPVGFGNKSRRLWKRLTFEPDDVRELRLRLTSNSGLWHTFVTTLSLGLSQSTKTGVERLNPYQDLEHLLTVAEWLSTSDYPAQQSDLINRCQEGTGTWLFRSTEYQAWLDGVGSTLYCPGLPGVGKTMITSIMINKLQQRFRGDRNVSIAYVYCNYKRQKEQTIYHLMVSLLKQLIQQQPYLPASASILFSQHAGKKTRPSLDEISSALRAVLQGLVRVYIVMDALDECSDKDKTRSMLLKEIAKLQVQRNICFFATSRFVPNITAEFRGVVTLEIRATDEDVRLYLDDHMSELPACVARNQALQEMIQAEIVKSAAGMFLLARLHLSGLSDKITAKEVKLALQDLPKGSGALEIAYAEALSRIKSQAPGFRRLAEAVLTWIVCAQRQLTVSELRHALAVEDGASDLAEDNLPEADEMVSVCAGMVTVDEESGTIRLVHITMQEYFESTLHIWAPLAHAVIAKACLTYLSFDVFKSGPCYSLGDLKERCQRNPLFDYAARYWGMHVEITVDEKIEGMALGFLDDEKNMLSSCQIVMEYQEDDISPNDIDPMDLSKFAVRTTDLKAMNLVACLGLGRLVAALLRKEQYVDHKDSYDRTPLSYAAENGREAVVRILLDQADVEVDCDDAEGRTPLSYASSSGNIEIAKLLMERKDVNINSKDHDSRTPLRWAVSTGQHAIVMLLLERRDLQICPRDHYGRTPLMECARRGFEHIARTLLQKGGYQIYAKDIYGDMALHQAVKSGHEKIVLLLLARGKNQLNANRSSDTTALIYAAREGHLAIVELLLEKDGILVNELGHYQRKTALMYAATCGHETIVRLLLKRDEIQVNMRDSHYQRKTALMYAATSGHETIVRLLLKRDEIQVNMRDSHARSALELAAISKRKSIVRLLLERKDVDLYMTPYTLENCSQKILKLIEQATDGRDEGHSWRDEPYEVPFF